MAVVWVDDVPEVEVIGDCVEITTRSGDHVFVRRTTRSMFRRFIDAGRYVLERADEESCRVVNLPRK